MRATREKILKYIDGCSLGYASVYSMERFFNGSYEGELGELLKELQLDRQIVPYMGHFMLTLKGRRAAK